MPKYTVILGELKEHRAIVSRIKTALQNRDFTSIYIFPTLSLLKEVREELINEPDIGAVGGIRLLLFEGFIQELSHRFGLEGRRPSPVEQELLITEAFFNLNQSGKLDYLNRTPFSAGYRWAMLEGIREWKRAGLTPELFKEWASGQSAKEQQLALVYEAYQQLLIERGLNEEDLILNHLGKARGDARKLPETTPVIMYGFTDLTPLQNDYLKILEFWFDFEFLIDPTPVPKLQQMVCRHFSVKIPDYNPVFPRNALEELQNSFWIKMATFDLKPDDYSLQMIQAAGPIREVTGIVREIAKLILENPGYQWDDFLILTPNPQEFIKVAGPIFAQYELKVGGGQIGTVGEYPVVNRFYEALTASDNDWQWPEMELLIRHFYAGVDSNLGDGFLLWLGQHYGAVSSQHRWLDLTGEKRFLQSATGAGFDLKPLLELIEWLNKIPKQAFLKDYLSLTKEWFATQMKIKPELLSKDPGLLALKIDNYHAAQGCIENLEEISRALEGLNCFQTEVSVGKFQQFLSNCWSEMTVQSISRSLRSIQGIKVIPPREARGLRAPVVFCAGLEQGTFPRIYVNDWKLAPAARRDLRTLGIELETGEQYQIQEALAFYWSLQTAKDRLYLVYRDQDDGGQPQNRSMFLDEILQCLPELEQRIIRYGLAPRIRNSYRDCRAAIERKEWFVSTMLLSEDQIGTERLETIGGLLREADYRGLALRLHGISRFGTKVSLGENSAVDRLLNTKFGADHSYSITAIEDYRSCPYRFFLKHLLKVRPAPKPTLLPELLDLGNLYHATLREFGKRFRGQSLRKDEFEHYLEIINECLEEQFQEWRRWAGSELADMILSLKQEEIRKTLRRWLESETVWTEATAGRFQMQRFEWSFGIDEADSEPDALTAPYHLDDGQTGIKIWGRVDRVDSDSSGNFTVYDYKLGKGPTTKDLIEMNNLQIPVYLLALEQLYFGAGQAAGGSYLGLSDPSRGSGGIWHQERLGPVLKSKGLLDHAAWETLLEAVKKELLAAVSGIRNGVFDLTLNDCPKYCEYRSCCRRLEREVETIGASAE